MIAEMKANWNWIVYYYIRLKIRKIGIAFIRNLPKRVVYWCVVRAAVEVEKNGDPSNVTALQMLNAMDYEKV